MLLLLKCLAEITQKNVLRQSSYTEQIVFHVKTRLTQLQVMIYDKSHNLKQYLLVQGASNTNHSDK